MNGSAKWFERAALTLAALFLVILFVLLLTDVVLRMLRIEFYWGSEASGLLMAWMIVLALPMVTRTRSHIATDFVVTHLPFRGRMAVQVLGGLLMLGFLGVLIWKCGDLALRSWTGGIRSQGILRLPVFWMQGGMVLGLGLLAVSQALVLIEDVRVCLRGEEETP